MTLPHLRPRLALILACVPLVACHAPVREPRPWGTADFSTPRAVLGTYFDALDALDAATMHACTYATTEATRHHRDNVVDTTVNAHRLSTVLVRHLKLPPDVLSSENYITLGSNAFVARMRRETLEKTVDIVGDRATIRNESPEGFSFRRVAGRWLIDFDAVRLTPAIEHEYANHARVLRAAMPVLADVESGRIRTYEEFTAACARALNDPPTTR